MPSLTTDQQIIIDEFLVKNLPKVLKDVEYDELYGHQLTTVGQYHNPSKTKFIITKYLVANAFDAGLTEKQLRKSLEWRKEFNPLKAAFLEKHDPKLVELGYVTRVGDEVFTWNIYGMMQKDGILKNKFEEFVRYRIGLMERGLQLLDDDQDEEDGFYLGQIHDYEGVSLLKYDKDTKRVSKEIIQIFQDYYPEFLSRKFFINVPKLMSWVYDLIKGWLPVETTRKFKMINNGGKLATFFEAPQDIPVKYGGQNSKSLEELNITDVKMTEYTSFLLEEQFTNELD